MHRLYQKIPFLLELFLNGFFIFLYSFSLTKKISISFLSLSELNLLLEFFCYLAPFVVLINLIFAFIQSETADDFFRRYAFSAVIVVPMLMTLGDIEFTFWLSAVHLFSSILALYEAKQGDKSVEIIRPRNLQSISILEKIKLRPAQIILLSFAGIILIGTMLLSLPLAAADGKSIPFVDALFIATSATCVTGLSTLNIGESFSTLGQLVILVLLQIGGLGYMTLYSSMTILLGKALAVKEQVLMQDLLDINSFEDLITMISNIIRITVTIEFWGGILLTVGFMLEGLDFGPALYNGFFHAISAFCNAGISLFSNSLEDYAGSSIITMTCATLITLGGLGFIVVRELIIFIKERRKMVNLSIHTKVVLITSLILIAIPAVYIFISEYMNGLNDLPLVEQLQASLFHSVALRSGGLNVLSMNTFYEHTIYLFMLIMFIGASPGSTGGGIKTTTFAILFQSIKSTMLGREEVTFFDRTIPQQTVVKAIAIIVIAIMIMCTFILILMQIEPNLPFFQLLFEAVSAFSTVGLSLGITPMLSVSGKVCVILMMFIGRVGPLTMVLAIGQKQDTSGELDYPEGRVMIG